MERTVGRLTEDSPRVSVIIPSLDGYREGNVKKLLSDFKRQSLKDLEVKLIKGITPNGKARNIGAKETKGKILIFIDDDVVLGNDKVLENLIRPLETDEKTAMTGAYIEIEEDAKYIQREYFKIVSDNPLIRDALNCKKWVQHSCLAIKRSVFEEIGGEDEGLMTGTDVDLNMRVKAKGYNVSIAPDALVYHIMPNTIKRVVKKAFMWGVGSAYAEKMTPEIFGLPKMKFINYIIKTNFGALIYKIISNLVKLPIYLLTFRPIHLLFYTVNTVGYIYGWAKFRR